MRRRALLLAAAAFCFCASAYADPGGRHGGWRGQDDQGEQGSDDRGRGDHGRGPDIGQRWSPDEAREGVRRGQLRPLSEIVGELQGRYGGRLLGQELANEGPRTVYHIRWVTGDGRLLNLVVDAQSR